MRCVAEVFHDSSNLAHQQLLHEWHLLERLLKILRNDDPEAVLCHFQWRAEKSRVVYERASRLIREHRMSAPNGLQSSAQIFWSVMCDDEYCRAPT
eukprot:CAMPEP_0185843408 /NCGR_PEP_ID=MMETSP1353-20130828/18896_1 /TAXON_ID=1077150 /ORGANISM="Erythrolobus australicus, Strain CCMP3124" /LENGTH=95 /DNA_ID=CAMNT_0028542919 /DNA_START=1123 /DNA_END=1407 /DNA_ORIENTATION=-